MEKSSYVSVMCHVLHCQEILCYEFKIICHIWVLND